MSLSVYTRPRRDGRSREELAEQAAALRDEGLRFQEIGKILGIGPETASYYVWAIAPELVHIHNLKEHVRMRQEYWRSLLVRFPPGRVKEEMADLLLLAYEEEE